MALCNYKQTSYFRDVFDPVKDFRWRQAYEIPEELQETYDPVGFWYFHRRNVDPILRELRRINKRVDLRDLLREMDRIWRFNNQQHRVLNEPDWSDTNEDVQRRVKHLTRITRARLALEARVDNQVQTDVIRAWEYSEPTQLPAYPKGTLSGQIPLQTPQIMPNETPPLFSNTRFFDTRVFIPGAGCK